MGTEVDRAQELQTKCFHFLSIGPQYPSRNRSLYLGVKMTVICRQLKEKLLDSYKPDLPAFDSGWLECTKLFQKPGFTFDLVGSTWIGSERATRLTKRWALESCVPTMSLKLHSIQVGFCRWHLHWWWDCKTARQSHIDWIRKQAFSNTRARDKTVPKTR